MEISSTTTSFDSIAQLVESRRKKSALARIDPKTSDSTDQEKTIQKLRARDQEVRAHEQAHAAAAGGLAKGGPSFTYERGPDGKQYAVGGEVNIDTSPVAGDPEATIRKAQQIRSAALAPADPSSQDRAVAASASGIEAQARQELQKEKKDNKEEEQKDSEVSPHRTQIDIFV
mgnify:CR=1 FL=1